MTIQEVAKLMGISQSAIRYYDHQQLLPSVKRDKYNNRVFTENDLAWIKMVITLRELGMPVPTIREYVQLSAEGKQTLRQRLKIMTDEQERILAELEKVQGHYIMINHWINHYVDVLVDPNLDKFPQGIDPTFPDHLK
ncbi:MerR family transcriptional regulator [Levilactobacillus cerevisiae]|uniref:MerR family transcriptional regulator n=1 Tax=Levilactobacillus cerevisiae TaxID=1704076 RepID=UPI000F77C777|nr:MerR family transcriptional regulator [Levilactobacillus cerevisiae]